MSQTTALGVVHGCWPWSHVWEHWADPVERVSEVGFMVVKKVSMLVQARRCARCGKVQWHEFQIGPR